MSFHELVAQLSEFARDFVDVAKDSNEGRVPDPASLVDLAFLAEVRDTLVDVLDVDPDEAGRQAPVAAALIVLEAEKRRMRSEWVLKLGAPGDGDGGNET